ncbi:hypothetical protein LCGC14_2077890 [marine sediment metagenome]|uniref:CMP/dCMP-type deaminase domain-containing protein n=1 Tax=marine sediment metagenome TaxID=412755 RepID=A0A0F9EGN6_9ZZZZ
MSRPDWDLYFIRIAKEVASRSTCPRAAVGAVIVKDNKIISTGYNGAAPGMPHCTYRLYYGGWALPESSPR